MSGTLTLTVPLIAIGVAFVIAALLYVHWHRQDAPYEEDEPSPVGAYFKNEANVRRTRAEARHAARRVEHLGKERLGR